MPDNQQTNAVFQSLLTQLSNANAMIAIKDGQIAALEDELKQFKEPQEEAR